MPNSEDIVSEIIRIQNIARTHGLQQIQIDAGKLHRILGCYP